MNKTLMGAAQLEFKVEAEPGKIKGYASIFGNVDQGGERVMPGAYAKSIASGRSVRMLWQHDTREVIGGWDVALEDQKGLWVEGTLNMDVQRGREAYSLMKNRQIEGFSIGYRIPTGGAKVAKDGALDLNELDLREVSIVTMPMNELAVGYAKAQIECEGFIERFKAGDRLTEREFETLLKGALGFSNSEAERAARVHLKGQGEPYKAAKEAMEFLKALRA
jgi:HK97 family phage prohead protease